ncbi:hypothetical protein M7I_7396 [Glarea lozoyensis 74030]|uniref:Uncharacterized protein n=1 Tax=Glarea lozoyensis (strain ATCC 74030 / MF5533) TaxID=1104152 RepID=H0EX69_GLAL7|nr:hypothetical protein M7I_7396 [Glarea lozoyensis 74030]
MPFRASGYWGKSLVVDKIITVTVLGSGCLLGQSATVEDLDFEQKRKRNVRTSSLVLPSETLDSVEGEHSSITKGFATRDQDSSA